MPSEGSKPDASIVVPQIVNGALIALKAAYSEPSVKRFVYTSSSSAAIVCLRGQPKTVVTTDTWTEDMVKLAWSNNLDDPRQPYYVYVASKTRTEQAIWKYYEEHEAERPDLKVNTGNTAPNTARVITANETVLPNMVYGKSLDSKKQGYPSTSGAITSLYNGDVNWVHTNIDPRMFSALH